MLVSEGKTALKRFGFSDEDPLLIWLNAAMRELEEAEDWTFLQLKATFNIVAGDVAISLPSPPVKLYSIRDMTGKKKLTFMTRSEFEREISDPTVRGAPSTYTTQGSAQVTLYPASDSTRSLQVFYQSEFVDMVNDVDTMQGPTRVHYTIVMLAASIGLHAENEEDRARSIHDRAVERILAHQSFYSDTQLDEPQQVTDVMSYGDR